jgi:hypothetical protein
MGLIIPTRQEHCEGTNAILREIYTRLGRPDHDLYYGSARNLIGANGEGTVDGNPYELDLMRIADQIEPLLRRILVRP